MIRRHTVFNRFHSIAVQLFFFFFIGMIVPVLIGGYLSYNKSAAIVQDQVSKVASLTITQVSDKMNLIFKKLDDTSMMLLGSKNVHKALEKNVMLTEYERAQNNKQAVDLLTTIMINSPEIMDIYIFDENKQNSVLSSTQSFVGQWDTTWYKSIVQADGKPVWFGLSNKSYLYRMDIGIPVFGMGRAIKSFDTGKVIGVVFIEVRGDVLSNELKNVTFGETGYAYVVDRYNRYFYHPNSKYYGKISKYELPKKGQVIHEKQGDKLMIPDMLNNGSYVIGVVPLQELVADSTAIRNLTVWIASATVLLAVIMGYYVTRKIGRPLVNLSKLMKRSEAGDLTVRSGIKGRNELGQLAQSFNKMIQQIDVLIRRIENEESQKKKAEIRALRYQIKPHFLYNTLNSIRWMAKLNRNEDVVKTITNLVQLLEASIERNGPFVMLGEELDLLEKYLVIQQYRYDNKITLEIDCPEELKEVSIPTMLLQPVVENAIFHGIAPKDDAGLIKVSVRSRDSDVVITITDNGIGMDEDKLANILTVNRETKTGGMTNIGLRHVHQTLKLHYGEQYGVQVNSARNEGTQVCITFSTFKGDKYVQSAIS